MFCDLFVVVQFHNANEVFYFQITRFMAFLPCFIHPCSSDIIRGGWTAPRKTSWEIRARFLIHARTVAKRTSL